MAKKNTSLSVEDKVSKDRIADRRSFLKMLGLGAVASAIMPPKADAGLYCQPDMFNPYLSYCAAGIDTSIIYSEAEDVTQNASQWCWAACIEMAFAYHGYRVSQERIVQETWGGLVDYPGSPMQIMQNLNKAWTDDEGNSFMAFGDSYSANVYTAAQDLAADYPLIIGALGHATILTSMSYTLDAMSGLCRLDTATVLDPWPGRGERFVSAYEWASVNFAARIRTEAF